MAHTVRIIKGKEEGFSAPAEQYSALLDQTAAEMVSTLPHVFRMLKHQARNNEGTGRMKDIGGSQIWALYSLANGRQLTSELARRFNVTNPTMTRIVDGLVDRKLVERIPDLEDRRCIYLQLTNEGKEAAHLANKQFHSQVVSFLSSLSEKQLSDIQVACRHLASLLPDGYLDAAFCPAQASMAEAETEVINGNAQAAPQGALKPLEV